MIIIKNLLRLVSILLLLTLSTQALTQEERTEVSKKIMPIISWYLLSDSKNTYPVASANEASSFLSHATFGATQEEIGSLVSLGNYETWFEQQFSAPESYHMDWVKSHAIGVPGVENLADNEAQWKTHSDALLYFQRDAWWDITVNGQDQLRQRIAFALSEIMVISKFGSLVNEPDTRLSFYDVLVRNALGNFETLLQEVTYHPSMGKYLSYLGNAKANQELRNHPDENYAREVMQLFSIGLYQLNLDGTKKLTSEGKTIPTYFQYDIVEMARVFTGLTDDNGYFFAGDGAVTHLSRTQPMIAMNEHHDSGEKYILGNSISSGGSAITDVNKALHILFMHPNTAPFISKFLIQRLVTSNPTPAYVERVSKVFNNNTKGIRGDMKAIVKAILLDTEALHGAQTLPETFGKFREPLLFVTHLFRAFHAQNGEHILSQGADELYQYSSFNLHGTGYTEQEGALEALSVFNYFTPTDAPHALRLENLVAPELEVYGIDGVHSLLMGLINKDGFIYETYDITAELQIEPLKIFLQQNRYDVLLEELNRVLMGGNMSLNTKDSIRTYMQENSSLEDDVLARYVIGLMMTSPDYALQR